MANGKVVGCRVFFSFFWNHGNYWRSWNCWRKTCGKSSVVNKTKNFLFSFFLQLKEKAKWNKRNWFTVVCVAWTVLNDRKEKKQKTKSDLNQTNSANMPSVTNSPNNQNLCQLICSHRQHLIWTCWEAKWKSSPLQRETSEKKEEEAEEKITKIGRNI